MNNRTIDKLVAEKVMGWKEEKGTATTFWVGNQGEWRIKHLWKPTENMDDAWQVVEKLRENFFEISIAIGEDIVNVEVSTTTDDPKKVYYAYQQESLPLAICKAALKTVGVEV